MQIKSKHIYLILLIGLLDSACERAKSLTCVNGEGSVVNEQRSINGFSQLILNIPGDVYISKGDSYSIQISAQANILDEIETYVDGVILEIDSDRCFKKEKTIIVEITMPELTSIKVKGSGDVYVQDLYEVPFLHLDVLGSGSIEMMAISEDKVDIDIDGSGDIVLDIEAPIMESDMNGSGNLELSGAVGEHDIDNLGTGDVEAFALSTNETKVRNQGTGDCRVNAEQSLRVILRGTGDVYYKGNPSLSIDASGTGEVVDAN